MEGKVGDQSPLWLAMCKSSMIEDRATLGILLWLLTKIVLEKIRCLG